MARQTVERGGGLPLPIRSSLLVALALAVAGCAQTAEEAVPAAEPVSTEAAEPAPEAEKASPEPAVAPAPTKPAAASPSPVEIPVAWDARSRPMACLPRGPGECGGAAAPNEGREFHAPELPGVPVSFVVTMTWTPESPLTETMALHAIGIEGCEDECVVRGKSPLEFRMDSVALEAEAALTFHVFAPDPCWHSCSGVKAFLDPGQAVRVEGVVVVAAGEAGEAAEGGY